MRAWGNSDSTSSRVLSVEELSTTITSRTASPACSKTVGRHRSSQWASFVEMITMARSAMAESSRYTTAPRSSAGEAARGELARRVVHAVDGVLADQPLQQRPHPILERRLGLEAQQLPGTSRVGHAVADVPGAVLAVCRSVWLAMITS